MAESQLKRWISSRKYIRSQVTRIYNDRANFHSLSPIEKSSKTAKLKSFQEDLKIFNADIQKARWNLQENETELNTDLETSEQYADKITECLAHLVNTPTSSPSLDTARSLLKSPVAPLPKFGSNEGEDLNKFLSQFEETINKFNYTGYDKLLLLKQQISGRALTLIASLELDKQSYSHAKHLLQSALASPSTQRFNVIKKISEMKLSYDQEPFDYISKMRNLSESVKDLKIETDHFLQFFFWNGLNETFKNQFIQITNNTRPSHRELNDHFFEACERYLNVTKSYKNKKNNIDSRNGKGNSVTNKNVTNFAVNADMKQESSTSFRGCDLCLKETGKEASHPIYKCPVFSDAHSKVRKIKSLNGCVKCGKLNHSADKCKFWFNKRCACSGWHFSYLCVGEVLEKGQTLESNRASVKSKVTAKNSKKEVTASKTKVDTELANNIIVVTDALPNILDSDSILPTFTCSLNGYQIRGLKDGGCQSNFISEKIAKDLNLKVLHDNVSLKVNGFNTSQNYNTKIVEAIITFGQDVRTLSAVCVPEIKIKLKLPKLSQVVSSFARKGYELADKMLSDGGNVISDLNFIMGTNSAFCLKSTEISFGSEHTSIFAETHLGVMLLGDIDTMLKDLKDLPPLDTDLNVLCSFKESASTDMLNLLQSRDISDLSLDHGVSEKEAWLGIERNVADLCSIDNLTQTSVNFAVLRNHHVVDEIQLQRATDEILESSCYKYINYDQQNYNDSVNEVNSKLIKFVLNSTSRNAEGRLMMPLLWNEKNSHLLGSNLNLARAILKSNLNKLKKKSEHLTLMDDSFKSQEKEGIIERIENLDEFLEDHPEHSFLPHMGVFKLDRETTKCRVVFLSNLCERDSGKSMTVSHNQAIYDGPNLNQKICSALLQLRFDDKLLCFDLKKAFNQISLSEQDSNKLLFLWYKNVKGGDFSVVGYKNVRLTFGLRCSPAILLLALYKILILDVEDDSQHLKELKKIMYQCFYMDNGAITANNSQELTWAYENLHPIFYPYKFEIQQLVTNEESLQNKIDEDLEMESSTPSKVKILGTIWDRKDDTLATRPINLDSQANTKRLILQSIASQYDIYNFNGPLMNRSRVFMHGLQCSKDFGWDDKLPESLCKEWGNIAKQTNSAPAISVPRKVGRRDDSYNLMAFSDSSKIIYGVVIYLHNIRTNEISFVLAKNRIVNSQLKDKSIPSLELQAVLLGTQVLMEIYQELSGPSCSKPIHIRDLVLYSDSLVSLSWLNHSNNFGKMQKRSVFVKNRLNLINKLCEIHPVTYLFVSGNENPSDCITRCLSYKQLMKTNYISGPDFSKEHDEVSREDILKIIIPNPKLESDKDNKMISNFSTCVGSDIQDSADVEHLVQQNRCSSFSRLVAVHAGVLRFVDKLKIKLKLKNPNKYNHFEVLSRDYLTEAKFQILRREQEIVFPEIFSYFNSEEKRLKDIPNMVNQLNIYPDKRGILRVKSKMDRIRGESFCNFPILLPKNSEITKLIIIELHEKLSHAGCYTLLSEMRKQFWIPHYFSVVKKILKQCIVCKRFNNRSIKINQSPYRDFRIDPPCIPFSYVYIDYLGPFVVREGSTKCKRWLLCITCMWSRSVNLKICVDMSVKEFLRAFQLHSYEFGIPQFCISDLGSQLTAAANIISDFLKDAETQLYFEENGVQSLKFQQFFKGCSQLGALVEVCVKMVKQLIFGAIRNNVLGSRDFEFLIAQTVHLVNRRPIGFKDSLRDSTNDHIPEPITPEILLKGYDLPSLNIIPDLQNDPDPDPDWQLNPKEKISKSYNQLKTVRNKLNEIYHGEFLATLIKQATDVKDRYQPVDHHTIKKGDIVLIREQMTKPHNYPMAVVKEVVKNTNDEITGAIIKKGKSGEVVKRHATTLIPLLSPVTEEDGSTTLPNSMPNLDSAQKIDVKNQRKSAITSRHKTKQMLKDSD